MPTDYEGLLHALEAKLEDVQVRHKAVAKDLHDKISRLVTAHNGQSQDAIDNVTRSLQGLEVNVAGLQGVVDEKTQESGVNFTTYNDEDGSDPEQWLRHFTSCAEFKNYTARKQLQALKILLKGGPATWLDNFLGDEEIAAKTDQQKLDAFKTKFVERFGHENTWLQEHLIHFLCQKPGETVQKYFSTLTAKAAKLNKPDSEILTLFIRGLQGSIKIYVLSRNPKTLSEAFNLAKTAESLQEITNLTDNQLRIQTINASGELYIKPSVPIKPEPSFNVDEVLKELRKLKLEISKSKSDERNIVTERVVRCHYCQIPGHRQSECRKRARDMADRRQGPYNASGHVNRVQVHRNPRQPDQRYFRVHAPASNPRPREYGPQRDRFVSQGPLND